MDLLIIMDSLSNTPIFKSTPPGLYILNRYTWQNPRNCLSFSLPPLEWSHQCFSPGGWPRQVKNGIQVCDHLFVRGIPSAVTRHSQGPTATGSSAKRWRLKDAIVQMGSVSGSTLEIIFHGTIFLALFCFKTKNSVLMLFSASLHAADLSGSLRFRSIKSPHSSTATAKCFGASWQRQDSYWPWVVRPFAIPRGCEVMLFILAMEIWLVGGLVAIFYFPINIGFRIIPIDELIFFRGVAQPPTR